MKILSTLVLLLLLPACYDIDTNESSNTFTTENAAPPTINYALINTHPHDTTSYTEGLLMHNGQLYESTGAPGDIDMNGITYDTVSGNTYITGKMWPTLYQIQFAH